MHWLVSAHGEPFIDTVAQGCLENMTKLHSRLMKHLWSAGGSLGSTCLSGILLYKNQVQQAELVRHCNLVSMAHCMNALETINACNSCRAESPA